MSLKLPRLFWKRNFFLRILVRPYNIRLRARLSLSVSQLSISYIIIYDSLFCKSLLIAIPTTEGKEGQQISIVDVEERLGLRIILFFRVCCFLEIKGRFPALISRLSSFFPLLLLCHAKYACYTVVTRCRQRVKLLSTPNYYAFQVF